MKWFYAQAAFIPIILSQIKDKMPINNTQIPQIPQIGYRNHTDTIDIDYYENLFRS